MKETITTMTFDDREYRVHSFTAFEGAGVFLFVTQKIVPLLNALNIGTDTLLDMSQEDLLPMIAKLIGPVLNSIKKSELVDFMKQCLSQVEVLMPAGYMRVYSGDTFVDEEIEHSLKTCFVLCFHAVKPLLQDFFGDVNWGSLLANPSLTTKQ